MFLLKWINIIGLSLSVFGSILVGLIAQGGVPKKGDPIKAPKYKTTYCGWIFIILGFLISLIVAILS